MQTFLAVGKGLALVLMEVTPESVGGFVVHAFFLVSAVLYRTHIKLFCRKYFITLNCLIPWAGVNKYNLLVLDEAMNIYACRIYSPLFLI